MSDNIFCKSIKIEPGNAPITEQLLCTCIGEHLKQSLFIHCKINGRQLYNFDVAVCYNTIYKLLIEILLKSYELPISKIYLLTANR